MSYFAKYTCTVVVMMAFCLRMLSEWCLNTILVGEHKIGA